MDNKFRELLCHTFTVHIIITLSLTFSLSLDNSNFHFTCFQTVDIYCVLNGKNQSLNCLLTVATELVNSMDNSYQPIVINVVILQHRKKR